MQCLCEIGVGWNEGCGLASPGVVDLQNGLEQAKKESNIERRRRVPAWGVKGKGKRQSSGGGGGRDEMRLLAGWPVGGRPVSCLWACWGTNALVAWAAEALLPQGRNGRPCQRLEAFMVEG